ncbi:MAG: hypothetical protein E7265_06060 [Lachnospiraceae bacterium]|nr:hypothetical protein [Lachnospiraceae bacterium]
MNDTPHNNETDTNIENNTIHEIMQEDLPDRKAEISNKIKFGDSITKIVLSIGFWGFWIFWLIVALM